MMTTERSRDSASAQTRRRRSRPRPPAASDDDPGGAIPSTKRERLLGALYEGRRDLAELAAAERLTLTRLAAWANEDETSAVLEGLCRLDDVRTQMLVSRYRTLAAAHLFELARAESGGELARRACVDLLRTSLFPTSAASRTRRTWAPLPSGRWCSPSSSGGSGSCGWGRRD